MTASYGLFHNGRILMFTVGDDPDLRDSTYDNYADPISEHASLEEAIAHREELGLEWFGLDEFPEIPNSIWNFYYTDEGWYCGENSEGDSIWNHWTATVEFIRMHMCRSLTDREITELSVSLSFGPTPLLSDEQRVRAFNTTKKSLVYASNCEDTRDTIIAVLTTHPE